MWSNRDPAAIAALAEDLLGWLPDVRPVQRRPCALPDDWSPTMVLERGRPVWWLDGGDQGDHLIPLRARVELRSEAGRVTLTSGARTRDFELDEFSVLEALNVALRERGAGGARWFGWFGYELGGRLERLPAPPDAMVGVADLLLVLHEAWLERRDGRWQLMAPADVDADELIADLLAPCDRGASTSAPRLVSAFHAVPDDSDYEAAVTRTVERIVRGEIFETNVCRRFEAPLAAEEIRELYLRMRTVNPARYGAFLEDNASAIMSMSPEYYLRRRGDTVTSEPIKGTRRRGATAGEDDELSKALLGSEKDGAELAMIVDLVRNDLARVCRPGSVQVKAHRELMRLPTVWHTCSRISGQLRAQCDPVDLLRATFPPGSITGAPKIQAMIAAAAEEPVRRGPSMGAIGWIDPAGDMELSVAIRTAVVAQDRVVYHAGCGIVADSDPIAEREETLVKARAFLEALAG